MTSATLTLDLSAKRGMEAFLLALDDPHARDKLEATNLPPGAEQLLKLTQDKNFEVMAIPLAKRILAYRTEVAAGQRSLDESFYDEIRKEGALIQRYLETNYPQGFDLLKNYAEVSRPNVMLRGAIGANLDIAANAEAVANAVVWANAAAATLAVVAAAVVVVIAVFIP